MLAVTSTTICTRSVTASRGRLPTLQLRVISAGTNRKTLLSLRLTYANLVNYQPFHPSLRHGPPLTTSLTRARRSQLSSTPFPSPGPCRAAKCQLQLPTTSHCHRPMVPVQLQQDFSRKIPPALSTPSPPGLQATDHDKCSRQVTKLPKPRTCRRRLCQVTRQQHAALKDLYVAGRVARRCVELIALHSTIRFARRHRWSKAQEVSAVVQAAERLHIPPSQSCMASNVPCKQSCVRARKRVRVYISTFLTELKSCLPARDVVCVLGVGVGCGLGGGRRCRPDSRLDPSSHLV